LFTFLFLIKRGAKSAFYFARNITRGISALVRLITKQQRRIVLFESNWNCA